MDIQDIVSNIIRVILLNRRFTVGMTYVSVKINRMTLSQSYTSLSSIYLIILKKKNVF
jgi:hypothetical protein